VKYISLCCIAVIVLYSCTRTNSTPNPPIPPVTQDSAYVLTSIITNDQIPPSKRTFTYGADGALDVQTDTSTFDTLSWKYIYDGSTIYINSTQGEKDTMELNSHGYITKFVMNEDASGDFIDTYMFTYTDDTLLTNWKFYQTYSSVTFDVNYFFDNGDLVRSEDISGTVNYDYYENLPIVEPDVNSRLIIWGPPGYTLRNKHLLKSVTNVSNQTINYTYTLDSVGRVLTESENGTLMNTYTYAHIPVKQN
jgi:hypothetical protein